MERSKLIARLDTVTAQIDAHYQAMVTSGKRAETPAQAAHFGKLRMEQARLALSLASTATARPRTTR